MKGKWVSTFFCAAAQHVSPSFFSSRHVAVLLTRQARTGTTLLRHITLKATDLAHRSSAFLQLPGAAPRPGCVHLNTYTLSNPNDLVKRGLILVFK